MTSGTIGRSYGMLGRFRLPKLANSRSPTGVFCKRRAASFTHPVWPTKIVTAKIVVLGVDSASTSQ